MRIQPVTSAPGENALFIVLGLAQGDSVIENVTDFAANFSALTRSLFTRYPASKFNAT
ncbi:peroxidase, partial [Acinetobacter pittii]|nr:peroxidase [Acinetobacter pittii]